MSKFYAKGQKVDITIDKYDTYNVDGTLAQVILPLLVQLKDTMHGIPNDFATVGGEDYHHQLSFDFYTDSANEAFQIGVERWNEVLDKMIWSFQQLAIDDYDSLYHHGKLDVDWELTNEKIMNPVTGKLENTYAMKNKSTNSWYDYVGHQLHEKRIQEGIDLFAKYYRNLWD